MKKVKHPRLGEVVFERISNHVPVENQDKVEHCLVNSSNFPWYYAHTTVVEVPEALKKFDDIPYLSHMMIEEGNLRSEYFHRLSEEIKIPELIKEYKLSGEVIRSQANLFLKRDKKINPCPHIDFKNVRHLVVLYYVNDCDGDTIFYNLSDMDDHCLDEMSVWRREAPKKGDILIFDGRIFHSPSCPVESTSRSTINYDFLIK